MTERIDPQNLAADGLPIEEGQTLYPCGSKTPTNKVKDVWKGIITFEDPATKTLTSDYAENYTHDSSGIDPRPHVGAIWGADGLNGDENVIRYRVAHLFWDTRSKTRMVVCCGLMKDNNDDGDWKVYPYDKFRSLYHNTDERIEVR